MQKFLLTNWCKIILSISAFILSVSILIFALKGNITYAKVGRTTLKIAGPQGNAFTPGIF